MWIRTAVVLAVVAAVGLGHAPLLRLLARPLLDRQSQDEAAWLCLQGSEYGVEGDATFEEPALWYHAAAGRRILLLQPWPHRVVELGVVPSFEQMARRELTRRGVPDVAIVTVEGAARDDWENARRLRAWLEQNAAAQVALVCSQFHSGQVRYVLDSVLDRQSAARVRIRAIADPDYDETNWWRSRRGVKGFMFAWLGLLYARGEGEERIAPCGWSVQKYQSLLEETYGKAQP
jgi:uncharacterized SAM-binding protein YcdF (DUF218 family)